MNIIDQLRNTPVGERPDFITGLYEKNRKFFREKFPVIDTFIEKTECPYHFNLTEEFLAIIHTPTNTLAHPESGLDTFAQSLGQDNHGAWTNLVNFKSTQIRDSPKHQKIIRMFEASMNEYFPDFEKQLLSGKTKIATSGASEKVLPPVVFAGIFHGLHIDYLLSTTSINRILLIEPEPQRFEVSCYFLDYEQIYKRFDGLPLNIGASLHENIKKHFHSTDKITSSLWFRILPCYESPRLDSVLQQLNMQQHILESQTTSYDRELKAIKNGANNITRHLPVLSKRPKMSKESHIAIVASGPSLQNDYEWLKKNHDRLIIFAVHSAVKPLRNNGVRADFQVNLDTYLTDTLLDNLDLDQEMPLLSYYKASEETMVRCTTPLLLIEKNVANIVDFSFPLEDTHPSTTTLATSMALYCEPSRITFLGVDVGFRDETNQFIGGGFHEKTGQRRLILDSCKDTPNFQEGGPVFTNVFFSQVKCCIERQLAKKKNSIEIYNCSDGVQIVGATALRSSEYDLPGYPQKNNDVRELISSFTSPEISVNYQEYSISGRTLLSIFKGSMIDHLELKQFNWIEFSKRIDSCLAQAIEKCKEVSLCLRMTIYERLIVDLLTQWYRYILLCPDAEVAEKVYWRGLEAFRTVLEELEWPGEYITQENN